MGDRFFYPVMALIALAMIGLALLWPQGLGSPSPPPFGHPLAPAKSNAPRVPRVTQP